MKPDCNYCKNRQKSLDPYGCWKEANATGFFGRIWVRLFGCDYFKVSQSWRVDSGRDE